MRGLLKDQVSFVVGGGRFGTRAVEHLKAENARVLVVDVNPHCKARSRVDLITRDLSTVDSLAEGQAALIVGEGIDQLIRFLKSKIPYVIVPAIPCHVAAKVVYNWLSMRGYKLTAYKEGTPVVADNLPKSLICCVDQAHAVIVASYMLPNRRCKENCLPPKDFCSATRRPKPAPMYELLKFSVFNVVKISEVFVSKQLGPGIGAMSGTKLHGTLKHLEALYEPYTLAIGTACKCHGVLNLFRVKKIKPT